MIPSIDLWRQGVAGLPLVILLVGLLGLRWQGMKAGFVALGVTVVLALVFFATPLDVLGIALWRGAVLSLDVLYIIWPGLLLYQLADATGSIKRIGQVVAHLPGHRTLHLLIIGFALSSFLEGVAGFGVPMVITAPLLLAGGFRPLEAAAVPLVGHAWAVAWGSLALPFRALLAVTGLPSWQLAISSATLLGVAAMATGFAVVHVHSGFRSTLSMFGITLALGLVMAGTQWLMVITHQWTVASVAAGLIGLLVSIGIACQSWNHERGSFVSAPVGLPTTSLAAASPSSPTPAPEIPLHLAFVPYCNLIAIIGFATLVAPLSRVLEHAQIHLVFPSTMTGLGWHIAPQPFRISVLSHPGTLILYAVFGSVLAFRLTGRRVLRMRSFWENVASKGVPATLTILAFVSTATVMTYSGMTFLLARRVTQTVGMLLPLISPFIGLLGTVITGSNTHSNVLFGALQRDGAQLLGMNPVLMAALQTAGGALGSMIAPAKVVMATAITGLAGQEGRVMRVTIRYAVVLAFALGVLGWILVWRGCPAAACG